MKRWVLALICAIFGLALLFCGLLVPMHLQAVDVGVIQRAGKDTSTVVVHGMNWVNGENWGAAQMLMDASTGVVGRNRLAIAVTNLAQLHPELISWGGGDPRFRALFKPDSKKLSTGTYPFAGYVLRLENRGRLLDFLRASTRSDVKELLRCRELKETAIFDPSLSSSGQAFDAALTLCGLLMEGGRLNPRLNETVYLLAIKANRNEGSRELEALLLDLTSLAQRMNWGQLTVFVSQISTSDTLHILADQAIKARADLDLAQIFAAVCLTGKPAAVANYLANFSQTGLDDMGLTLRFGAGAVNELLQRNQRLHVSSWRMRMGTIPPFGLFLRFAADLCWLAPALGFALKWLFILASGFLFALTLHFCKLSPTDMERPLQVRGLHLIREFLFALGFLLMVLILSEPFLAQKSQKVENAFRLRVPTVGAVVSAGKIGAASTIMNQLNVLTLLVFFVLQGLIYTVCLVKLAEIRRQNVPPRLKLKLLDNEDHLFDAGLYLGFVGTIISLILVSLGIIEFSLMAAYSSTSFGIIFVSIFKIFHLRGTRRKLLLEVEAEIAISEHQSAQVVLPS